MTHLLLEVVLIAVSVMGGALLLTVLYDEAEDRWRDRQERRRFEVADQQARIQSDAVRVKLLLDQEAFRAARALHEAARRSRRR